MGLPQDIIDFKFLSEGAKYRQMLKLFRITILIFCVVMVGKQVYEAITNFISYNPTYSTKIIKSLRPEYLPSIQICPRPGWDLDKLEEAGYSSTKNYYMGTLKCQSEDGDISASCSYSWQG